MKLLLDTHLLIWAAKGPDHVPRKVAEMLSDPDNSVHFSVVSIWEVAIKTGRNRPDFDVDPQGLRQGLLDVGYYELPIVGDHAVQVRSLPPLHTDPFDRLLLAQAWVEGLTLLTSDALLGKYPGPIQRV